MELGWFECLVYGLLSGITELLPVSSLAHQTVLLKLIGKPNDPFLQLSAHLGVLAAVLICCMPTILRLRREKRLLSMPKKRRRRQPDFAAVMELRVFRMAALSMVVVFIGYGLVQQLYQRLWILAILMAVNGAILYIPQYLPGANKTAESLSGLDAMLIGIAAGYGMIPGISRTAATMSAAQVRGTDRRYGMELALLLSIPAVAAMMLFELFAVIPAGAGLTAGLAGRAAVVAAASFAASYCGCLILRFLSVNVGFSGFSYYCWGLALFSLILYLI